MRSRSHGPVLTRPSVHSDFFNYVVKNDWSIKHIPFQKKAQTLPVVLNKQEVAKLLFQITKKKYYAIAVTFYSSGRPESRNTERCLPPFLCYTPPGRWSKPEKDTGDAWA